MAGDWIKLRNDIFDDPDVMIMSDILDIDCPTCVGHLCLFWSWIGRHTSDGCRIQLSKKMINRKIGIENFCETLEKIGWLDGEDMDLSIPNFERHNGNSAKARALESEAKRIRRSMSPNVNVDSLAGSVNKNVGHVSDKIDHGCRTREEKRREEKSIKNNLSGTPDHERDDILISKEVGEKQAVNENKKKVKKRPHKQAAEFLIDYLNEKIGSRFEKVDSNLKRIEAVLSVESRDVSLVQQVIDFKVNEWGSDEKMVGYLRPSTLFRPENFSNYVGQLSVSAKKSNVIDDWINGKTVNSVNQNQTIDGVWTNVQ